MDENTRQVLVALIGTLGGFAGGVLVAKLSFDQALSLEKGRRAHQDRFRWTADLRQVAARFLRDVQMIDHDALLGAKGGPEAATAIHDLMLASHEVVFIAPTLADATEDLRFAVARLWRVVVANARAGAEQADVEPARALLVTCRGRFMEETSRALGTLDEPVGSQVRV